MLGFKLQWLGTKKKGQSTRKTQQVAGKMFIVSTGDCIYVSVMFKRQADVNIQ